MEERDRGVGEKGEGGRHWSCNNQAADEQLENAKLARRGRQRQRRGVARQGGAGRAKTLTTCLAKLGQSDRHAN